MKKNRTITICGEIIIRKIHHQLMLEGKSKTAIRQAVVDFKKLYPNYYITNIYDAYGDSVNIVGSCEFCGALIFDDEKYLHDDEGIDTCWKCMSKEDRKEYKRIKEKVKNARK